MSSKKKVRVRQAPKQGLQPKKAPRKNKKQAQKMQLKVHVAPCTQRYIRAVLDPFAMGIKGVCVPDLDTRPSRKIRTFMRSGFSAGPGGYGWVMISPFGFLFNTDDSVWYTGNNYVGTGGSSFTKVGTGVSGAPNIQSPYSKTSNNNMACRLVSLGVRARYVGTELDRGGRLVTCALPSSTQSLVDFNNDSIFNLAQTKTFPATRDWVSLVWIPQSSLDFSFSEQAPDFGNDSRFGVPTMVVGCRDTASGNAWEFEIVAYSEYVGTVIDTSPSDSDVTGFTMFRNTMSTLDPSAIGGEGMYRVVTTAMQEAGVLGTSFITSAALGTAALGLRTALPWRNAEQQALPI